MDSGFEVEIDYADDDSYMVAVTVDDNLVQEHLKVELDGDTLHIGLAPLWNYHDVTIKARVGHAAAHRAGGLGRVVGGGDQAEVRRRAAARGVRRRARWSWPA